jgi:hypothetical protein
MKTSGQWRGACRALLAVAALFLGSGACQAGDIDLTGKWQGDTATYWLRQVGNEVWWICKSKDGGKSFTVAFHGKLSGTQLTGNFADVPPGKNRAQGSIKAQLLFKGRAVVAIKGTLTFSPSNEKWENWSIERASSPPAKSSNAAPAPMRFWLEVKPAQRIVAVLTADITHPATDKIDESVIFAPQVPNLPGQKDVKTAFSPKGMIVREEGPLKRPLVMAKISDGRKKLHIVLTITATLMSRKLRPLDEGEAAPKVADLSAEQVKWYTRYSYHGVLEPNPKPFRDWLTKAGLKRKAGEDDLVFAYRVFQYIQRHFRYKNPPGDQSLAAVCASGQSDCGGLSGLFIGVMRDNGVPARHLTGRMATPGGNTHIRAEFFARGVGWVPVDAAAAVSDSGGITFDYFGNDPGDLLALSQDPTGKLETFVVGKLPGVACQGIGYWWRGTGKGEELRWQETWTVKKETKVLGPK